MRNGKAFVCDAIDSALAQEASAAEVIVVDNRSTDGTVEMVKERYGDRVTLADEERPGAARARNLGIRLATLPWVAFLDADDVWLPNKIARQAALWREHPEADLLFTLGQEFLSAELDAEERTRFACRPEPYALRTASSLLCKRETFLRVGEFPDVPGGEFIAWYGHARDLGLRELIVTEVLVRRRIHGANTSRTLLAGYTVAARWLLEQRRARAKAGPSAS